MNCSICGKTAVAICRFCGRSVCKDHLQTLNYIISVYPSATKRVTKSLVVADAVYCGVCKPQPEPLETPYLD
jgi:hypothetical protein